MIKKLFLALAALASVRAVAEVRLGDVVMKDVVVLEPSDKQELVGMIIGATQNVSTVESDPVALPRVEALEAQTNSYLQAEQDLRALRLHHYGDPDIVESPDDWFQWSVSGGEATVAGFNWGGELWDPPDDPAKRNIVIPWEYDGVPVAAIGSSVFTDYNINSLAAPKTLASVGGSAFFGANILSLHLPAVTSMGVGAFMGANILSLHLPSITTIGGSAFARASIDALSLPSATSVGSYAFMSAKIPSLHLPAVTSVGSAAFARAEIPSITFSRLPTTIGDDIFYGLATLPTIYITDPTDPSTATELQGAPIVRPTVTADSMTLGGETITEWPASLSTNDVLTLLRLQETVESDPVALPIIQSHTNRTDNPHQLTAAQLGALTPGQLQAELTTYSATGTVLNAQIAYEALRATEAYALIPLGPADLQLKAEIAAATNEIITGGAIGASAKTGDGFAGGKEATTLAGQNPIDAIQLGTGNNPNPLTLRVYDWDVLDAQGNIPYARIEKAFNEREPVINVTPVNGTATVHMVAATYPTYVIDIDEDVTIVAEPAANAVSAGAAVILNPYAERSYTFSAANGTVWDMDVAPIPGRWNEYLLWQLKTNPVEGQRRRHVGE